MPNAYERRRVAELAEGGRRAAKTTACPRCAAPVIIGEDHDTVAAVVTVDVEPLDRVGEMLAVLDGRVTCTLERQTGKTAKRGAYELWHRYEEQIHGSAPLRGTLHAEHRCNGGPQ